MSVVVVGLEHRRAPLDLLERVTVAESDLPKVLGLLRDRANLEESVLLSTCLRTEVYAVVDRFHDAVSELQELLSAAAGLNSEALADHLTIRFDDDVADHLFSVAAGLESAVLGETEVLGQVRRAWEAAEEERVSGPVLGDLFRHAVQTGRRVRAETAIARGTTSFSHAAVEVAERQLAGGLAGRRVVVLGAGEMGAGVLHALRGRPAASAPEEIVLANRTAEPAESLAGAEPDGRVRVVPLSPADYLSTADVLIAAVRAPEPLIGPTALQGRDAEHPLVVVDLGVPRNVDPTLGALGGVTLINMDDLRDSVDNALDERRAEVDEARGIMAAELRRYQAARRARGAAPVVASLRGRLESARLTELARRRSQFGDLSDADWAQVEAVTRSVLAKLLHEPSVVLKETAGTARGERLVEALRTLFDL